MTLDAVLKLIPYGENIPGPVVDVDQMLALLDRLSSTLEQQGLKWTDVGLLLLANSKAAQTHGLQAQTDLNIKDGLTEFCRRHDWFPSLIGSSTFSSFFRSPSGYNDDISDGLLVVAVCSAVFDRIPIAHEVNLHAEERPYAGARVLVRGLDAFAAKASQIGVDLDRERVADSSTGILLTTGSGHIVAEQKIDFKECYAIGQELLDATDQLQVQLVGGCATNRSKPQLQCLYYSETIGTRTQYRYTYNHAAIFTLLPYTRARLKLDHPYQRMEGVDKLAIKFDPRDAYDVGRSFYVEEIDGRSPIDFVEDYWHYSRDDLLRLVEEETAIPAEPDAHWVTIACSLSRRDKNIWPNIPVWLEKVQDPDGEKVLMRMVRAEDDDANYYLMELRQQGLRENARDLMASLRQNYAQDVSILAFLCESRKYVLNSMNSNAEATEMIGSAPAESTIIGLYVNGEYSTGHPRSIGYHNYSQIGAIIPHRERSDIAWVPPVPAQLELLVCRSRRDGLTVEQILNATQGDLRGTTEYVDENARGDDGILAGKLKRTIGRSDQLVIFFVSDRTINAEWMLREVGWVVGEETRQRRKIAFVVLLDDEGTLRDEVERSWPAHVASGLEGRYVILSNFSAEGAMEAGRALAEAIKSSLSDPIPDSPGDPFANL